MSSLSSCSRPWRSGALYARGLRYLFLPMALLGAFLFPGTSRTASTATLVNPPIILSEATSTRAIALESLTLTREPFSIESSFGGLRHRTRIMVFAMNLPADDLSVVTADAEDADHGHYALTVEAIRPVSSCSWMNAVVLKLNDAMGDPGDVLVSVSFRGVMSNRVRIGIGHIGGGLPNDSGSTPTPAPPYTIAGKVLTSGGQALSGISVSLSGGQSATVVSGADGSYSFSVNTFGDFVVTPIPNSYYVFTPQVLNHLHTNRDVNFTGALRSYTVSGRLTVESKPGAGVSVSVSGSLTTSVITNANGEYSFSLPVGGNYTISPTTNVYYTFTSSNTFVDLTANKVADFTGIQRYYTVSGWVQLGPHPAPNVVVPITGSQTTTVTTDENGNYSISLPAGGNYTLAPSVTYYTFDPGSHAINDLTSSSGPHFFVGARKSFAVRGRIKNLQNTGLPGITINLTGAEQRTTVTDANGNYQFSNLLAGFYYSVAAPSTELYTFPAGQSVNDLSSDQTVDVVGLRRLLLNGRVIGKDGNGIIGVTVTLGGTESANTRTGADGSYAMRATETGSYTVTPSIEQDYYSFAPTGLQFNSLKEPHNTNFAATMAPDPNPQYVLEFDGQPKTDDHLNFWQEGVDLGHFFWEFWAMPGSDAARTYMISDGYGGAHALLFGVSNFNSSEPDRYELFGNIFDGVTHLNFFGSDIGPAVGEWGHFAVGWDGRQIITYLNGVPVGKTVFNGPRRSPGPGGGGGRALIGGSDHNNFIGRIAQVRGYENANPREESGNVEASFAPETVFSPGGNLLSNYFRSGPAVADLSRGYNGVAHTGFLRGTVFGVLYDCRNCPPPRFVLDPTAPNFATATASAPVNVPTATRPPAGALVFDSFARANSTYTFGAQGGLGSTEAGSAGIKQWQLDSAADAPRAFGILNARAVLLANSRALTWVSTSSPMGNLDISVERYPGRFGSGKHTGLSFRVLDKDNFFFAYTRDTNDPNNPGAVHVGYYLNGQRTDLTEGVVMPANWTTLRVITQSSGDLKVYVDGTVMFLTNNQQLKNVTGAGLYNNSSGLGLVNRWDNFTVLPAP